MSWRFPHYDINKGVDWVGLEQYDWFRDMANVEQDHIWHGEGNVMVHTKMVCEALLSFPEFQILSDDDKHILVTSALFHDVEKRSTTTSKERDGRICIVAPKHALYGAHTTNRILYRDIPTPFDVRLKIVKLVYYHGIPLYTDFERLLPDMIESSLYIRNSHLALLSKADVTGRTCPDTEVLLEQIEMFKEYCIEHVCLNSKYHFNDNLHRYIFLSNKGDKHIGYKPFLDVENDYTVHVLVGLPGAGKDYYTTNWFIPSVSIDDLRRANKIKPTDKKGNGQMIQLAKESCKVHLRKNESFIFNATNITREMRLKWISLFKEYGASVTIHYVETEYKTLLSQNKNREYPVPEKVIEKLLNKLELPQYDEADNIVFKIN